jgi:hypothetical protein
MPRSTNHPKGFAILAALLIAAPASAAVVTHSSLGTLFDETYEDQTVGATPATADIDPDGNGETWDVDISSGSILTRNDASDAALDANEGEQYVRLERLANAANIYGNWASNVSSGDLTVKFAANVPGGQPDSSFVFHIDNLEGNTNLAGASFGLALRVSSTGQVDRRVLDDPFWIDTGLDITPSQWQDWTIVYHLVPGAGNDSFDLTIDNNTANGLPTTNEIDSLGFVSRFGFRAGNDGTVAYVDAQVVPEPASAAILAAGMTALLRPRRRGESR